MKSFATLTCLVVAGVCLLGSAASASPYSAAVNSYGADLLSYWQFNGTIANGGTSLDSTGQRNGTYNSGGGSIGAGLGIPLIGFGTNQSLQLSGGGYMSGTANGVSNDLPSGNDARTYTGWIETTNGGAAYHDIFSYGTNGFGQSIFTLAPPSSADGGFGPTAGVFGVSTYNPDVAGTSVVNDGVWHMVAFTVTPSTTNMANVAVFVDGKLEGSANIGTNTTPNTNFEMGIDALGNPFTGSLAQVAVFNSALSAQQISGLYSAAFVPEPSSLILCGFGMIGLLLAARRRRRS